jgi:2-hydroxychromene-2-carboxylate isomerase
MTSSIDFYFEFPSPYAYLAHTQLPRIAAEHGATIVYHPFRILELMKIVGNRPTTIECKNKGKYAGADLQRWVKRYKVEFSRNPHSKSFDFAELDRGVLVAIEDGRGAEYVTTVFSAIWGKPEDLSQRPVLIDVLSRAGFDSERLLERASADNIRNRLDAETRAAAERGVFGAPTIFVGDQMFFGNDRLDFVVEALRSAA